MNIEREWRAGSIHVPMECGRCMLQSDELYYRRKFHDKRKMRTMKILLWATLAVSIVQVAQLLLDMSDVVAVIESEIPDVKDAFEQIRDEAATDEERRLAIISLDVIHMVENSLFFIIIVMTGSLIFIPARYLYLILHVKRAHPHTLRKIRFLATIHILIELASVLTILIIFSQNEILKVNPKLGLNLILAPATLIYSFTKPVKQFFSDFKVDELPEHAPGFQPILEPPAEAAAAPSPGPAFEIVER